VGLDKEGALSLSLRNAPADLVIEAVAEAAGLDLVMPPLKDLTLTLHVRSESVAQVLSAIRDIAGVDFGLRGRILVVYAPGRHVEETRVYPLAFARAADVAGSLVAPP
jgi:hypothetical protein